MTGVQTCALPISVGEPGGADCIQHPGHKVGVVLQWAFQFQLHLRALHAGARKRTEQSFFVPKEEIAANGYDLSINKYKETEYVPVEYPSTQEILADLHELEMEITKGLAELEEMV